MNFRKQNPMQLAQMVSRLGAHAVLQDDELAALVGRTDRQDSLLSIDECLFVFDQLKLLHLGIVDDEWQRKVAVD